MDTYDQLHTWMIGLGIDPRELARAIGFTGEPGSNPRGALATLVGLCDLAQSDDDKIGLLAVQFVAALIDLNWQELRDDLAMAARSSPAFRQACSSAVLDDAVPDNLVAELSGP